jgi:hypothetical protein
MLILVGVTINITLKGNLFESAEKATTETEKYAILEQIIEMAVWNNGDVEVDTTEGIVATKEEVVNWDSTTGKLTIKGKKGTYDYKLSKREITIWEERDNPGEDSILGTYYDVFIDSGGLTYTFSENGVFTASHEDGSTRGTYTYNENTKTGEITVIEEYIDSTTGEIKTDSETMPFSYITVANANGDIINSLICWYADGEYIPTVAKNSTEGLTPLTGYVYKNGSESIEFVSEVKDGFTYGKTYYRANDEDTSPSENCYLYFNGEFYSEKFEGAVLSDDFSTLTLSDGTVYTKQ